MVTGEDPRQHQASRPQDAHHNRAHTCGRTCIVPPMFPGAHLLTSVLQRLSRWEETGYALELSGMEVTDPRSLVRHSFAAKYIR